jgi:hypothetical protein
MADDSSHYVSMLVGMRFDLEKTPMRRSYRAQIEQHVKTLSKLSLPELKAEYQRARIVETHFGKPEYAMSEEELVKKTEYEDVELSDLSTAELQARYEEEQARYESAKEDERVAEMVEAHRFRSLTPQVRSKFFGPPPEFAHWTALDYWTAGEAASLSMGLNPNLDLLSKIPERHKGLVTSTLPSRTHTFRQELKSRRKIERGFGVMGSVPLELLDYGCERGFI